MSFFRPHKTKPRQFNYIPRHYDPVKEERERRRRELHGTSTDDDQEYTPGKYIRTQREARDAARGERTGYEGLGHIAMIAVAMVLAMLFFLPRFIRFVERANEEKITQQTSAAGRKVESDDDGRVSILLDERHGDIDFREFESLTPEALNEIEEWQNSVGKITIYDDDVEIVDGKRVE